MSASVYFPSWSKWAASGSSTFTLTALRWYVCRAPSGSSNGDAEVVLGDDGRDDGLAGSQGEGRSCVGGGGSLPGRIEDPAQKIQPLIFFGDAGEVARWRVARRALAGAFEVRAAGRGVAGGEVGGLDGAPPAPKLRELIHLRMQESDDRIQLALRKARERRHAGVRATLANDGG